MSWCEENDVHFVLGVAKNVALNAQITAEMAEAEQEAKTTKHAARRFKDFAWTTTKSWTRERRVVAKAEWTGGEANPRFVVTSLHADSVGARALYEDIYCARGEMENRIKEAPSYNQGWPICSATARRPQRCAPTSCGCGCRPWPMC